MKTSDKILTVFSLFILITCVTSLCLRWDILRNDAIVAYHTRSTQTEDEVKLDYYGRKCLISIDTATTNTTTTLISAGRDGVFDTSDDIMKHKIDYNKSRIIGKWIGQKGKQFTKGLIDGIKDRSE